MGTKHSLLGCSKNSKMCIREVRELLAVPASKLANSTARALRFIESNIWKCTKS